MSKQFDGKVVIATGAASGIGRATAEEFARRGAAVAAVDRNRATLDEVVAAIAAQGGSARSFPLDITDAQAVEQTVAEVAREFGGVDVLAHSAGIQRYGTAASTTDEVWNETIAVNVTGAFLMSRAAIPRIIERGGGSVIIVGSVQSLGAAVNAAAYVTSKHAALGLVRSIALDFASKGIRAHCICPGAIDTPMLRWAAHLAPDPAKVIKTCEDLHLVKRLGKPEEVAKVIAFLASEEASFMTGQPVLVDGGCMVPIGGAAFAEGGTGSQG
jgi:NAD(P)-dependent dehydrogenase (short-subunit alcohol dehydrogenase family)